MKIERAHRSGNNYFNDNTRNTKRTIIAKFLNFKDKQTVLEAFRSKKLWNENIFVNEDFSERTLNQRRELFKKAKGLRYLRTYPLFR